MDNSSKYNPRSVFSNTKNFVNPDMILGAAGGTDQSPKSKQKKEDSPKNYNTLANNQNGVKFNNGSQNKKPP